MEGRLLGGGFRAAFLLLWCKHGRHSLWLRWNNSPRVYQDKQMTDFEKKLDELAYKYSEQWQTEKTPDKRTPENIYDKKTCEMHFKHGARWARNDAEAEIQSLYGMIKLWEDRNAENTAEIERLRDALELITKSERAQCYKIAEDALKGGG